MQPTHNLQKQLEQAFSRLSNFHHLNYSLNTIADIIFKNLAQGRIQKWLELNAPQCTEAYVETVIHYHNLYAKYIRAIQIEQSEELWIELYENIRFWIHQYLIRKGFFPSVNTTQLTANFASEAAMVLIESRFPFDIDFHPWARLLVINVCRHQIRDKMKQSLIPDTNIVHLNDDVLNENQVCFAPNWRSQESHHSLLDLIDRLPNPDWRDVIMLRYFYNLKPAEIATELGKTPSAVYNAHLRALNSLRCYWIDTELN